MKALRLLPLIALLWALPLAAQQPVPQPERVPVEPPDTIFFALPDTVTDAYLDTVQVRRKFLINDYSMVGVHYGVSLLNTSFNPVWSTDFIFQPHNFGITYTRYGKMFGFMPYFGFQIGVFHGYQGYKFKYDKEKEYTRTLEGASKAVMECFEVPFLAHMHLDVGRVKILANVGIYGGYRWKIHRYGDSVTEGLETAFKDTDYRWDYGIKGGLGMGLMFDPIEIHLTGMVKWAWQSLYQANWYSPYYYRYAYPFNVEINLSIHYQLSRRSGRTKAQLKQTAKRVAYETYR